MAAHTYQRNSRSHDDSKSLGHWSVCSRPPLTTTISLRNVPTIINKPPFYLRKEIPDRAEKTGSTNLLVQYGLLRSYNRFARKKTKKKLSHVLPHLPGDINKPAEKDDKSTLRSVVQRPPISQLTLLPLSKEALTGFQLRPGAIPEKYKIICQGIMNSKKNVVNKPKS